MVSINDSTSDGHLLTTNATYATARTTSTASVVNATADSMNVGQSYNETDPYNPIYEIWRSHLYFDTSAIPSDSTIHGAKLYLYGQNNNSDTDFEIQVQKGEASYPHDPLVVGDYDYNQYSGNGGTFETTAWTTAGYNEITLNSTGVSWIQKGAGALTTFSLRSDNDIGGVAPTDKEYVGFWSREKGASYAPSLVILHSNVIVQDSADSKEFDIHDGWHTPVSVTSFCGEESGFEAIKSIDGSTESYWSHATSTNHEIIFEMEQSYDIRKIQLFQSASEIEMWGWSIGLKVYVSDSTTSFGASVWEGALFAQGWQESGAFSKRGKYIKLRTDAGLASERLYEIQAYAEGGPLKKIVSDTCDSSSYLRPYLSTTTASQVETTSVTLNAIYGPKGTFTTRYSAVELKDPAGVSTWTVSDWYVSRPQSPDEAGDWENRTPVIAIGTVGTAKNSSLTSDASSGQTTVVVDDGSQFAVNQWIKIEDSTPQSEYNEIASISGDTIVFGTTLSNAYTTAQSADLTYGIECDGVADQTEWQEAHDAMTSGGKIYILNADYTMTYHVITSFSDLSWVGESKDGVVVSIHPVPSSSTPILHDAGDNVLYKNVSVRGTYPIPEKEFGGIKLGGGEHLVVRDWDVRNVGAIGVYWESNLGPFNDIWIFDCYVEHSGAEGINYSRLDGFNSITTFYCFDNTVVEGGYGSGKYQGGGRGISVWSGNQGQICNNVVIDSGSSGIGIFNAPDSTASDILIQGNVIQNSGVDGLGIRSGTVGGVRLQPHGEVLNTIANIEIKGNLIDDTGLSNQKYGVQFWSEQVINCTITDNNLWNNEIPIEEKGDGHVITDNVGYKVYDFELADNSTYAKGLTGLTSGTEYSYRSKAKWDSVIFREYGEYVDFRTSNLIQDTVNSYEKAPDITNAFSMTETVQGIESILFNVSLSLTEYSESLESLSLDASLSLSDIADSLEVLNLTAQLSLEESAQSQETTSLTASLSVTDTINTHEELLSNVSMVLQDIVNSAESVRFAVQISIEESASANESLSLQASLTLQEFVNATESILAIRPISLTDYAESFETVAIGVEKIVTETVQSSEVLTLLSNISLSDSAEGFESLSVWFSERFLTIYDQVNALESAVPSVQVSIEDSIEGTESLIANFLVSISESVQSYEALSLQSSLTVSDSVNALETVDVFLSVYSMTIQEQVNSMEIIAIPSKELLVSEIVNASEVLSITASLTLADSVTSAEVVSYLVAVEEPLLTIATSFQEGVRIVSILQEHLSVLTSFKSPLLLYILLRGGSQ